MSNGPFLQNAPKEIHFELYNITKIAMDILPATINDRQDVGISAAFKTFIASFYDYSSTELDFDIWEGNTFLGHSIWSYLNSLQVLFHFLDSFTTRRRPARPTAAGAHPGS